MYIFIYSVRNMTTTKAHDLFNDQNETRSLKLALRKSDSKIIRELEHLLKGAYQTKNLNEKVDLILNMQSILLAKLIKNINQ